ATEESGKGAGGRCRSEAGERRARCGRCGFDRCRKAGRLLRPEREGGSRMPKPHLVTIGPSHYCEKARWALERAGIEYVENAHAPVLHYGATLFRHLQRTTPILVTPHGTIKDSTAILRHADKFVPEDRRLFPSDPDVCADVEALEEMFDRRLGPATRRLAY